MEEAHLAADIVAVKRVPPWDSYMRQKSRDFYVDMQRPETCNHGWLRELASLRRPTGGFHRIKEQIRDTSEEVKTTPNELEVFMEVRETMLLDEHEASENPHGDPTGTGVGLQKVEAATSTQIRLKQTLQDNKQSCGRRGRTN